MGMLERFNDIVKSNINAVLDKLENPAKMIDQYLRDLTEDLAEVKKETAGVMAEEARTKRLVEENQKEVAKYDELARRALQAGNEEDARVLIAKKQQLVTAGESLQVTYQTAKTNAEKMRQMHDKLVNDISSLEARRSAVKAKLAVAKTQEKVNEVGNASARAAGAQSAFDRMEAKADRMLDEANAMSELNEQPVDDAQRIEEKYAAAGNDASVAEELEKMKKELGL